MARNKSVRRYQESGKTPEGRKIYFPRLHAFGQTVKSTIQKSVKGQESGMVVPYSSSVNPPWQWFTKGFKKDTGEKSKNRHGGTVQEQGGQSLHNGNLAQHD